MISGRFGDIGELFFEIELIAADGEPIQVEALLDTGFTSGWLAINTQDIDALGWSLLEPRQAMQTAQGEKFFDFYTGKVRLDGEEFTIPVVSGEELPEMLIGLQWLKTRRMVVDFPLGVLNLG
ncbi:aspartyl protease [Trichocoleus sp. FACHB-90]|uniref:aspartyl protease n=1 Tax=Cyanophyceae TaxID=3028117 RepID=UPI00168587C5|nr:aspartyl protease [Trichocoleus sp. FACHB-90]MBD1927736.1 aspartyl protease [Trichocoleus sp. FACHB-90]